MVEIIIMMMIIIIIIIIIITTIIIIAIITFNDKNILFILRLSTNCSRRFTILLQKTFIKL